MSMMKTIISIMLFYFTVLSPSWGQQLDNSYLRQTVITPKKVSHYFPDQLAYYKKDINQKIEEVKGYIQTTTEKIATLNVENTDTLQIKKLENQLQKLQSLASKFKDALIQWETFFLFTYSAHQEFEQVYQKGKCYILKTRDQNYQSGEYTIEKVYQDEPLVWFEANGSYETVTQQVKLKTGEYKTITKRLCKSSRNVDEDYCGKKIMLDNNGVHDKMLLIYKNVDNEEPYPIQLMDWEEVDCPSITPQRRQQALSSVERETPKTTIKEEVEVEQEMTCENIYASIHPTLSRRFPYEEGLKAILFTDKKGQVFRFEIMDFCQKDRFIKPKSTFNYESEVMGFKLFCKALNFYLRVEVRGKAVTQNCPENLQLINEIHLLGPLPSNTSPKHPKQSLLSIKGAINQDIIQFPQTVDRFEHKDFEKPFKKVYYREELSRKELKIVFSLADGIVALIQPSRKLALKFKKLEY